MIATRNGFEVLRFPVMQSSFSFTYVELLAVYDLEALDLELQGEVAKRRVGGWGGVAFTDNLICINLTPTTIPYSLPIKIHELN